MSEALSQVIQDLADGRVQVVDLTVLLGPETPVIQLPAMFSQTPQLSIELISKYDDNGPMWYWNVLHLGEHTGTHFDAPSHWVTGKDVPNGTTDTLSVDRFVGPACVIDVSSEVSSDPDFLLMPDHIRAWESDHGQIPAGSWVLQRTDWSQRTDPKAFFNADENGPHTPGIHRDGVELLIERDILGFGVETVGTDAGQAGGFDPPFPAHNLFHGAGKLGLASLCNLDRLPPTGALLIAAPLKIVEGSGSPVRAIALSPGA